MHSRCSEEVSGQPLGERGSRLLVKTVEQSVLDKARPLEILLKSPRVDGAITGAIDEEGSFLQLQIAEIQDTAQEMVVRVATSLLRDQRLRALVISA